MAAAAASTRVRPATDADTRPTKRNKKAASVPESVTQSLAAEPQLPSEWCRRLEHPYGVTMQQRVEYSRHRRAVWELFVPRDYYPHRESALLPTVCDPDTLLVFHQLFFLFGYVATMARHPVTVTVPSDEEGGRPKTMRVPSNRYIVVTWEVVMKVNRRTIAGYRLRLTEMCKDTRGPLRSMEADLQELLDMNDLAAENALKGKAKFQGGNAKQPVPLHKRVTTQVFLDLCNTYAGPAFAIEADRKLMAGDAQPVSRLVESGDYHPQNVFSLRRSLDLAHNVGAHPRFCDDALYYNTRGVDFNGSLAGWADPSRVYRIAPQSLHPDTLTRMYMPTRTNDPALTAEAASLYALLHGLNDKSQAERFYSQFCAKTSAHEQRTDIHWLSALTRSSRKELQARYASREPREFFRAWRVKQLELDEHMSEVFNRHGDCAPSLRMIDAAIQAWLQANERSFCIRRRQTMRNLTRFQDFWAQQLALLETIVMVKTSHRHCVRILLSYLGVYLRRPELVHGLELGPAGAGKSYAMKLPTKLFLPDTYLVLSDMTSRALNTGGKISDALCLVFDDAPSSLLGVQQGNKTKSAVSSDKENLVKTMLTETETVLLTCAVEPNRHGERIRTDCCSICVFAMNDPTNAFPAPILDRCVVTVWPSSESAGRTTDNVTMLARNARVNDPAVQSALQTLRTYWQRTQMLVAEIGYRIAAGIIKDITMEACTILFGMIAARAKSAHALNMDNPRHFYRWKTLLSVLVIIDAIDLVWDGPESPFADDVPHENEHFLAVEKHLVARIEHGVMALGLISQQWEDGLKQRVLSAMRKKKMFHGYEDQYTRNQTGVERREVENEAAAAPEEPDVFVPHFLLQPTRKPLTPAQQKAAERARDDPQMREAIQKRQAYDAMQQAERDWMYATVVVPSPTVPALSKMNASREEHATHLANLLMPFIEERPMTSEVAACLMRMMEETTKVKRLIRYVDDKGQSLHQDTYEEATAAVLILTPDAVKVSLDALMRADETDILFRSTREVLNTLYACGAVRTKSYLYGETEHDHPYVWRCIHVEKQTNAQMDQLLTIHSAGFFDEALRTQALRFLEGIEPEGAESREAHLFKADSPWMRLGGVELDVYATEERSREMGLHPLVQDQAPTNRPDVQRETLVASEPSYVYPDCYTRRDMKTWNETWQAHEHTAPERFSMRARVAKSREERALLFDPPSTAAAAAAYDEDDFALADQVEGMVLDAAAFDEEAFHAQQEAEQDALMGAMSDVE